MGLKFGAPLDFPNLTADPSGGVAGQVYWNTTDNKFRKHDGSIWSDLDTTGGGSSTVTAPVTVSGSLKMSEHLGGTASSLTLAANTLHLVPVYIPIATTVDAILINVNASAASSVVLGIVDDNNGIPGSTVVLDAGPVSVATNGQKSIAISLTLPAGLYWLAISTDTLPPGVSGASNVQQIVHMGKSTIGGSILSHYRVAFTYDGTLPSGPYTLTAAANTIPHIALSVAP